jgi:primosomal protein N' (replication factor Y) (superfamily II helicase)
MQPDILCQVAVSSATFAIDKPYTYVLPAALSQRAAVGMRVLIPFGRGNTRTEGLLLSLQQGERSKKLKSVLALLDDQPLVSKREIQLALWMRDRYFCTVYDAVKAMLPAGLYFSLKDRYSIAEGVDKAEAYELAQSSAERKVLDLLYASKNGMEKGALFAAFSDANPARAIKSLLSQNILSLDTSASRAVGDKQEQVAVLTMPAEEAMAQLKKNTPSQKLVLQLMADLPEVSVKDIRYYTGVTTATVKALEKKGLLRLEKREVYRRAVEHTGITAPPPELNAEQQTCLNGLEVLASSGKPACALLYGVTGSGKTQVYIRLIHTILRQGRTALVLVPEIALTPQVLAQFSAQFGDEIALLHSMLPAGARYDEWKRVRSGKAKVVVGTRSAVFAPLNHLGLIVLDEEQEASYKSENAPRYHARDVAKYRAAHENALLVLGSATPSVESMYFANNGTYHLFTLKQRYNRQALPQVIISDMKEQLRSGSDSVLGTELRRELTANIQRGEQTILFINRRGSSKMAICSECGESPQCPRCSVRLTYHKANGRLMCHYCGHSEPLPRYCPSCGGELIFSGAGTQKVQEEVERLFPGIEVLRMDTDTISPSHPHEKMLDKFRRQKIPVLVGTQMVAKGLDFENVTLVGVIAADQSLYVDDYRAAERTFSLLTQVVGRAGRGARTGRAIIQTYTPQNDIIRCASAQDYDSFYQNEIFLREMRKLPPYRDMYVFTVSGENEGGVLSACMRLRDGLYAWQKTPQLEQAELQILGPAAAPVLVVNKRYRYRVTVFGRSCPALRKMVGYILKAANTDKNNRNVAISADLNPMD